MLYEVITRHWQDRPVSGSCDYRALAKTRSCREILDAQREPSAVRDENAGCEEYRGYRGT